MNNYRLEKYGMGLATLASENSKVNGTHVGAAILQPDGNVVSIGWNGNPVGADDKAIEQCCRDERLMFAIHAEENALLNALRKGSLVKGCSIYVTHHPCISCMGKIINAGITKIFTFYDKDFNERWKSNVQHLYPLLKSEVTITQLFKENYE